MLWVSGTITPLRRDAAARRMAPTGRCLDADDRPAIQVDFRLKRRDDPMLIDGFPQFLGCRAGGIDIGQPGPERWRLLQQGMQFRQFPQGARDTQANRMLAARTLLSRREMTITIGSAGLAAIRRSRLMPSRSPSARSSTMTSSRWHHIDAARSVRSPPPMR
jgi:hypothetical protein